MALLYHSPLSAPSRAIRLLVGEYGLDIGLQEEQVQDQRAGFLDINPAGTVPVLVTNDRVIAAGGSVIAEFLDETVGIMKRERRLHPEGAGQRAEMRRLTDWAFVKLEQEALGTIVYERVTKRQIPASAGGGAPDSAALRRARAILPFHLKYLGYLTATRNWIAGDEMTFADLAVGASMSVLDYVGEVDWSEDESLKNWYAKLKSRPSFRPLLADRVRGMPPVSHYVDLDF